LAPLASLCAWSALGPRRIGQQQIPRGTSVRADT